MREAAGYYDMVTWTMYHRICQARRSESETSKEEENGHNASFVSTSSTTQIEQNCEFISSPSFPPVNDEHDDHIFDLEM